MIVEPFYTRAERNARYQELKTARLLSEVPARLFRDVIKWTQSEATGQFRFVRYNGSVGKAQKRHTGHIVWYVAYNEVN